MFVKRPAWRMGAWVNRYIKRGWPVHPLLSAYGLPTRQSPLWVTAHRRLQIRDHEGSKLHIYHSFTYFLIAPLSHLKSMICASISTLVFVETARVWYCVSALTVIVLLTFLGVFTQLDLCAGH